ncbi:ribose-5-phosphate isomerase RpiA [Paenibacillus filicis]|uniref:Ribose-5-phosphate isomerase A n=1 Tax=Paenibacillus gyeongsangnamensis TaxID=3388067 RepID=A0ABT4Q2N0_9BACL|nr:ribose-5-phosphate isomerase RpiA [Paenibacillus filicis]MCZ8511056.1 ribose-5-phosphate isomerase RpiA [Paenibacillus filicis]
MNAKKIAGEKAADYVKDGMTVGLGTGSTVYWTILKLGERVKQGLELRGVPTSERTRQLAEQLGIPLVPLAEAEPLDLTIDGADEISDELDLIKGGGGALFREKMVALASKRLLIVADESKRVQRLGAFPLPVEVVPFAWEVTARRIERLGCHPRLRLADKGTFLTDNGNFILDCDCGLIAEPAVLNRKLKELTGVVDTGLFIGMADTVIIGASEGAKTVERQCGTDA